MENVDLARKCISLDCDTIYFTDILTQFRASTSSCCFYFEDLAGKPIFSYLNLDESNRILEVKEKVPISNHANTGRFVHSGVFQVVREFQSCRQVDLILPFFF